MSEICTNMPVKVTKQLYKLSIINFYFIVYPIPVRKFSSIYGQFELLTSIFFVLFSVVLQSLTIYKYNLFKKCCKITDFFLFMKISFYVFLLCNK